MTQRRRRPRRGPSDRSGRYDHWFAAAGSAAVAGILAAPLWEQSAVALAVGLVGGLPALAFAIPHRIIGRRLVFWSRFRPRAWRVDDITSVDVQPYGLHGTTYGVRVERDRRGPRRRRAVISSTYSGSRRLVDQAMLELDRRLRQMDARRYE